MKSKTWKLRPRALCACALIFIFCVSSLGMSAPLPDGQAAITTAGPNEESAPAPVEEPIVEPTPAPVEEPIDEPTPAPEEEPVDEPTPDPVEEPIDEPTPDPEEEPADEPTPDPVEEPIDEPTPDPEEEPVDETDGSNTDTIVVRDEASGVEFISNPGTLIGEPTFAVRQMQADDSVFDILAKAVANGGLTLADTRIYDISLLNAELVGSITVNLPIPASFRGEVAVWHIAEDATLAKVNGVCNGSVYTFETTHFGLYALTNATQTALVSAPAPEADPAPVEEPIVEPTPNPVEEPIVEPTPDPEEEPIVEPTPGPVEEPIVEPTPDPEEEPTDETDGSNTDTIVVRDEASGVEFISNPGTLIGEPTFAVRQMQADDSVFDILAKAVANGGLTLADTCVYDITLLNAELVGSVVVNLPIPTSFAGEVAVWHIAEDGTAAKMDGVRNGDVYTFETTHFSIYALTNATETALGEKADVEPAETLTAMEETELEAGTNAAEKVPSTGVELRSDGWIILLFLCAALSLILFLPRRRRR